MPAIRCVLASGLIAGVFLILAGCESAAPAELTNQQVCLSHYENDPVERERCRLNPEVSQGSPPDVMARQLPERSGQKSD